MYLFLSVAVVLLWVLICLFYNEDRKQTKVFIKREGKDDSTLLSVFLVCHPRWMPCSEGFLERTPLGLGK